MIWINTVCKGRIYQGSAGLGLNIVKRDVKQQIIIFSQKIALTFHTDVFIDGNWHEISDLFSEKNKMTVSKCYLSKVLPTVNAKP